jgi:hypothetical protein
MSFIPASYGLIPNLIPPAPKTYAAWPVWHDSTTQQVKFQPMPKRQAVKRWHEARRFERQTRQPGKQDGAIGRNGLAVLHALLFDFLNYASGALYPSWAAIAYKGSLHESALDCTTSGTLPELRPPVGIAAAAAV